MGKIIIDLGGTPETITTDLVFDQASAKTAAEITAQHADEDAKAKAANDALPEPDPNFPPARKPVTTEQYVLSLLKPHTDAFSASELKNQSDAVTKLIHPADLEALDKFVKADQAKRDQIKAQIDLIAVAAVQANQIIMEAK
jgi:hypothetical protein